jgi:hypothetical protein
MGKAATQRKLKRIKYLANLAKENPERFEMAWNKRLSSWIAQTAKDAGRLRNQNGDSIASPFERVEEAMLVLSQCGDAVYRRHAPEILDLLKTECCRQVAGHADRRLFRMNNYGRFPSGNVKTEPADDKAGRSGI